MKQILLFLLISQCVFGQVKLAGTANQLWYPQSKTIGNAVRLNFTSQFVMTNGEVTLSPTWQNFPKHDNGDMDTYLQNLKANGVYVMVNLLNGFYKEDGGPLKRLPKDYPGADNSNMANWSKFKKLCEQTVLRYGNVKNDDLIDIKEFPVSWKPVQENVSGLGVMDAIQILNEVDNNWVDPPNDGRLSGTEYGHLLHYLALAIWAIDPNMAIVTAPMYQWHEWWINDVITAYESHGQSFPHYDPSTNTGIIISFNTYLHGCSYGQTCRTPSPINEISEIGKPINDWLVARGAYAFITEHGCNSEYQADIACYDYPNKDKYEDQAQFYIESTDAWNSFSNIIGAFAYQGQDDPNEWRFQHTGILFSGDGLQSKPSYQIIKDYWQTNYLPVIFGEPTTTEPIDTIIEPIDTVIVIAPSVKSISLTGGKYHVWKDGQKLIGFHWQYKEALERAVNTGIANPDSDVEISQDKITVKVN